MLYRDLGSTGIKVSEVGFGGWGIGGTTAGPTSYGNVDERTSLDALSRAFDRGITFYDTAPAYGDGRSESLIGRAFRGRRDHVVIATKAGYQSWSAAPDFSPMAIRRSVEGSLARLGCDWIDLLQLHSVPSAALTDDVAAELHRLREAGHIRAWGVSPKAPAEALAMIQTFDAPVVQVNLNMLDVRAFECGLLDHARERGVAVIARTPLCFGFLTGTLTEDAQFPPEDHRSAWPQAQIAAWVRGAARVLAAADAPVVQAPGQVALRFCLSHDAVSTVIPGMLTPAEAETNAAASGFGRLSAAAVSAILDINQRENFLVRRAS